MFVRVPSPVPTRVTQQVSRAVSVLSPEVENDQGFINFFGSKDLCKSADSETRRKNIDAAALKAYGVSPEDFDFYVPIDAGVVPQMHARLWLPSKAAEYVNRFAAENLRRKETNKHSKSEPTVAQIAASLKRSIAIFELVGIGIRRFQELTPQHIYAVCAEIVVCQLSPGTAMNRLSALRQAFVAVGKEAVWDEYRSRYVQYFSAWPSQGRIQFAQADRSLGTVGLEINEILAKVPKEKEWVGKIIELSWAFGTRIGESTRLRVTQNWHGNRLHIDLASKPKSGRERDIYITSDRQVAFVENLIDWIAANGDGEQIFPSNLSDKQAIAQVRYYFLKAAKHALRDKHSPEAVAAIFSRRPSIRYHDLRHDFIHRNCKQMSVEVPVANLEGTLDIVSYEKAILFLMLQVGHAAPAKIQAYIGKLLRRPEQGFARYRDRDMSIWGHEALYREIRFWGCFGGGKHEA
jgi:hypothetical protein